MTISDSKWYNEWNATAHFKEWMIGIPTMTKNRYTTSSFGWLQIEWLSKETALNPNLGGFFKGSVWGGGVNYPPPPPSKIAKLESWNLARKYTFLFSFRKYAFQKIYQGPLNIENISFTDYASGLQLPHCYKLAVNWKNINDVTIFRHDVTVNFFCYCFVTLVNFSYLSKFNVNIFTGSGVMTVSF